MTGLGIDARDRPGDKNLRAEPSPLLQGAARELISRHARREPEVILDSRGRAGLPPGRLALDHDRPQPLRRSVHRGGQTRGTRPHDDRVVLGSVSFGPKTKQLSDSTESRPNHSLAADHPNRRPVLFCRIGQAVRAGARYVANSPALRVILLRAGLFMLFANSIWALLPLVARSHLHLGSGGYGLLLGGVGVGAVAGAVGLPRLRGRVAVSVLLTGATLTLAAAIVALAYVRVSALAAVAVVVAGVGWILVLSILNSQYQGTLPGWANARGMSYYQVVFQGGGAVGAAAFGLLAQHAGLSSALLAAGIGLALVALAGLLMPFKAISPADLMPAGDWPDPQLVTERPPSGPVLVTVEYRPKPGLERDVIDKLYAGRLARRRTGAVSWCLWVDAADPRRILEQFVVGSWDEHLRQLERVSRRDEHRLTEIAEMTDPSGPPTITHWLASHPNDTTG